MIKMTDFQKDKALQKAIGIKTQNQKANYRNWKKNEIKAELIRLAKVGLEFEEKLKEMR